MKANAKVKEKKSFCESNTNAKDLVFVESI